MGPQGLNIKNVHRIERATGLRVLRAMVDNGADWRTWFFAAERHLHGWYDPVSGEWAISDIGHASPMCEWLFGAEPRLRDESWGKTCSGGCWHVA